MRKSSRIVFALAFIVILSMAVIYFLSPKDTGNEFVPADPVNVSRSIESLNFSSGDYQISIGEQITPIPEILPADYSELLFWSSSDETVAVVDQSGTVTALGAGQATITASAQLCSASVAVTVTDSVNWRSATLLVIEKLASDCGNGTTYIDAQLLYERLSKNQSADAVQMAELLSSILAYASGAGQRERLIAAVDAAGAPELACLTAANACWAKHEMLTSDAIISFAGDVTLARYNESARGDRFPAVYAASGSYTYPFDRVKGIFSCDSMTVVNFEGTLTGSSSHKDKTFYFRGDPLYAGILPASGIDAAGLENNHAGDYYSAGFNDTVSYLQNAGVSTFYSGQPLITETGGVSGRLQVVMLGMMYTGSSIPDSELAGMINTIRHYDTPDTVVVVNIHWGVEGDTVPTRSQQKAAHAMVDAGADLIIGHHPHVLQGIECYNGRYIAYSLGNFSFGGNASANAPETIILRASIGSEDGGPAVTGISAVPCHITSSGSRDNNYQPCIRFGRSGQSVISTLLERSAELEYGIEYINCSGI